MMRSNHYMANQNWKIPLRFIFIGILSTILFIFGIHFFEMWKNLSFQNSENGSFYYRKIGFLVSFSFLFITIMTDFFSRMGWKKIAIVFRSKRLDLFIYICIGVIITFSCERYFSVYLIRGLEFLRWEHYLIIVLFPSIMNLSVNFRKSQLEENAPQEKGNISSIFFVEKEISDSKDDMFNFNDKAETFSRNVINNEETACIVYGIDSPWGSGKSSFLRLCRNHWTKVNDETILFEFNPLRYDSDEKLLLKFIEGLSDAICHEFYIPELRNSLNLFAKEIQSLKPSFSLGGFNLTFGRENISFNSLHHSLEQQLYSIDVRVIVIIDDLDRLEIGKIKEILYFARFLLINAPLGEELLEINSRLFRNEEELKKFLRWVFLVFDKDIFSTYWKKNKKEIMEYSEKYLIPDDKKVIAFQYDIEYSILPLVFKALDKYSGGTYSA